MNFEKTPQSYWMASVANSQYPSLNEDIKVDVAIIGGGMVGISCGYMLAKEGVKLAIIDSSRVLQGTTGHTTAKITSQHELIYHKIKTTISEEFAMQYADANETAIRKIEEIIKEHKIDCDFVAQSAYVFTNEDKYIKKIIDEVETAKSLGINATYLDDIPLDIPIEAAIRFDNQAQFHPLKYLSPLLKKITDFGGAIYENTKVVDLEEENGYIVTTQEGKKVFAKKVIIATHYPFYNKAGMYFAKIYTKRSYVLALRTKEKYCGGMYICAGNHGYSYRSQADEKGDLILLGGGSHKTGQGIATAEHYENLLKYANDHYSIEDIPYRWSTQDCMTLDGIPYVGYYLPETKNLYIATGFGKWGMTNSTVSAMLLKDLIVKGKSEWEDVYHPARKTVLASTINFTVENLNVAKELIGGKIEPIPYSVEVGRGESKVFSHNGDRIGAYRDENGKLHLVNTTCTHMGCELQWNSAELSWDCPCHGSRFSYEGKVIEGPAIEDLEQHKDVNIIEKLVKDKF